MSSRLVSFIAMATMTAPILSFADYEECKDILRDGIRDKINTSDTLDYRLARKHEFCKLSSRYKLDTTDFDQFARDYAKKTHTHKDSTSNGTKIGYGPFTLGNDFANGSNDDDLSEEDKIKWLKTNQTAVRDFRDSNCGKEDLAESLQTEAILYSEIANKDVVEAWRTCMVEKLKNGMFVDVIKDDPRDDLDSEEVTYTVNAYFKSDMGVLINSMSLNHTANVTTGFAPVEETNGEVKTGNILPTRWGWSSTIASGGNKMFNARHFDRTRDGKLIVKANLSTGNPIERTVTFPKKVAPVVKELVKPVEMTVTPVQTDPIPVVPPQSQPLKSAKIIFHVKNDDLDPDSALHIELKRKSDNVVIGTADLPGKPKHDTWKDYTDHTIVINLDTKLAANILSKNELMIFISMTPVGKDQWIYQFEAPFEFYADVQLNHIETYNSRQTTMYPKDSKTETVSFDCAGN